MADRNNLEASSDIRATAVILIIVSLISFSVLIKSMNNLKYKAAQLLLIPIYIMPIAIGWISWVQLMNSSELRSIQFVQGLLKAVCLTAFLLYIQRMIGWDTEDGKSEYSEKTLIENLTTGRSPRCICPCIKIRKLDSNKNSYWYIGRIRSFVFQLCVVFILSAVAGIIYALSSNDTKLHKGEGTRVLLILSGINVISSVFALLALLNFGMYADSLPSLSGLKVLHKFVIIKLGLLFTEIQPLIIQFFASQGLIANNRKYSNEEITMYMNSLLVVSEMIIMSFLLVAMFPLSDYDITPAVRKSMSLSQSSSLLKQ